MVPRDLFAACILALQSIPASALQNYSFSWVQTLWTEATAAVNGEGTGAVASAVRAIAPGSGINATRYSVALLG